MIGELFPLEIKDFPFEMIMYDYIKHGEEIKQLRSTLQQVHRYNNNKENFNIKQTIQWSIYVF